MNTTSEMQLVQIDKLIPYINIEIIVLGIGILVKECGEFLFIKARQ